MGELLPRGDSSPPRAFSQLRGTPRATLMGQKGSSAAATPWTQLQLLLRPGPFSPPSLGDLHVA